MTTERWRPTERPLTCPNVQVEWKYEAWSAEERGMAVPGEATYFWVAVVAAQVAWLLLATIALVT